MKPNQYNATVEVETPDGEAATTTYTIHGTSKMDVQHKLRNHFGDALKEIERILKGGNGGAGGTITVA